MGQKDRTSAAADAPTLGKGNEKGPPPGWQRPHKERLTPSAAAEGLTREPLPQGQRSQKPEVRAGVV